MSEKSFRLISEEEASEVLDAASANQKANEHLTEYCGCAIFRYGDKAYFIIVPDGTSGDEINPESGAHALEILNPLLEMIGDEETGCGNPLRPYVGYFLQEEGLEESDFYQTLVKSVEKSMARRGIEGPIPADFFEPVPVQESGDNEIPEELLQHIRNLLSPTSNLMMLQLQWHPEGIEITQGKSRVSGFSQGLQLMLLRLKNQKSPEIPEELLQHVRDFLSPSSDVISLKMQVTPQGLSVDAGRISIQMLAEGLEEIDNVLDEMINSIRGRSGQQGDMPSFEEFLKANGINLGGNDGDWLSQLDETEQLGDDADFASTDENKEE